MAGPAGIKFNAFLTFLLLAGSAGHGMAAGAVSSVDRVSTSSAGAEANGGSHDVAFAPNGKLVAFSSIARNLVAGDTNGQSDIFVKDLATGATTLISRKANNRLIRSDSFSPIFSPDSKKVAFDSWDADFVTPNPAHVDDIFVKTLATGAIQRVSQSKAGVPGNDNSLAPVFTPNGKAVVFQSDASNLIPNDTNSDTDIFIKTLSNGAIRRISVTPDGSEVDGGSFTPQVSPDGAYVMYSSFGSNMFTGDANGEDLFLYKLSTGDIWLLSSDSQGVQANGNCTDAQFSPDGSKIVFVSTATNLVSGGVSGTQIYVKTLASGTTKLVSASAAGVMGDSLSANPHFSPDGKSVIFSSLSSNLVAGDSNGASDIFIKTLATGAIRRVSVKKSGAQANGFSEHPVFSGDGSRIAYESQASNLVAGDRNSFYDIFVAKLR